MNYNTNFVMIFLNPVTAKPAPLRDFYYQDAQVFGFLKQIMSCGMFIEYAFLDYI
jgi:hypothetical protein